MLWWSSPAAPAGMGQAMMRFRGANPYVHETCHFDRAGNFER
jgi:hypothetical protein